MDASMRHRPARRAGRRIRGIVRGDSPTERRFRAHLAEIAVITIIVDAIGTALVFMFEHGASGSDITNVGDALFWVTAQLLTVSSSMSNPLTTGGRVVDVVLMAYAVLVIGAVAGAFQRYLRDDPFHDTGERAR